MATPAGLTAVEEAMRAELYKKYTKASKVADEKVAPLVEEKVPETIKETKTQKKFTTVYGNAVPCPTEYLVSADMPVSPEIKHFIPSEEKFKHYNPTYDLYYLQLAIESHDRICINGPTGSGKSSLVEYICAKTKRPFIRVNCSGDMETSSLLGTVVVEDGNIVWRDGPITQAVRHGGVLCLDEWTVLPSPVAMSLQWLLEDGGKLLLADCPVSMGEKLITPHKDFVLVCTDNTKGFGDDTGGFSATQVQNTATLDRFTFVYTKEYPSQNHEAAVLTSKYPEVNKDYAFKLCKFAVLVRDAYGKGNIQLTLSTRTLLNIISKISLYGSAEKAIYFAWANKLPDATNLATAQGFYKTVFGKSF